MKETGKLEVSSTGADLDSPWICTTMLISDLCKKRKIITSKDVIKK
jgi:hypothetical protein